MSKSLGIKKRGSGRHTLSPNGVCSPNWVDPDSPYHKEIFSQDKTFVFHCASGWRSAITVATLQDMGFEAAHLREGFSTWTDHSGPVEVPKPRD